jgi:hypothetical protein
VNVTHPFHPKQQVHLANRESIEVHCQTDYAIFQGCIGVHHVAFKTLPLPDIDLDHAVLAATVTRRDPRQRRSESAPRSNAQSPFGIIVLDPFIMPIMPPVIPPLVEPPLLEPPSPE